MITRWHLNYMLRRSMYDDIPISAGIHVKRKYEFLHNF